MNLDQCFKIRTAALRQKMKQLEKLHQLANKLLGYFIEFEAPEVEICNETIFLTSVSFSWIKGDQRLVVSAFLFHPQGAISLTTPTEGGSATVPHVSDWFFDINQAWDQPEVMQWLAENFKLKSDDAK